MKLHLKEIFSVLLPILGGVFLAMLIFQIYKSSAFMPSLFDGKEATFVSPYEHKYQKEYFDKIKERTCIGYKIIKNLYEKNKNTLSKEQMEFILKESLREIRFNDDYFFIVAVDGTEKLFPILPKLEGKNLIDLKDEKGKLVIQNEINVAKTKGEGFVSGYWKKSPKDLKPTQKISYIKIFKPLNWIIGYGEYTNELNELIKLKVRK